MQNEQKLTGKIVEFQRDRNDPNTVKIRVRFDTWNGNVVSWEMLIPFQVNPSVTDAQLGEYLYVGREMIVNIKAKD